MIVLLFFAFLAGLVTILTPCIWPLLPIVLSATLSGKSHRRPLGITLGIMLSFTVATLLVSTLVRMFGFDPNVLRLIAVVVIAFLGLTFIIPRFSVFIESFLSRMSSRFGKNLSKGNDFSGGFITGIFLGLVWSPCAGPILATIAVLASIGKVTLDVVLVTLFYVLGVGIPLFIFTYAGQQFFTKTRFVSKYLRRIQQVFGVIMLLTALAIYTNYDTFLQSQILNAFPAFNTTLNGFESSSVVKNQLNVLKGKGQSQNLNASGLFNTNIPAPDFTGGTKWLNTPGPISIKDLKGRVVLVDFWTYTCINCIRTLPHVTAWYEKYKKDGFVVIGVHTPEFQFEHNTDNVLNAIKMFNIRYPVVQDNNYAIWGSYNNQYWPAEYLIDANGDIRREDFGEGQYTQMEEAIRALLRQSGHKVGTSLTNMPDQTPKGQLSPETYLGSNRMQYYYPDQNTGNLKASFTLSDNLPQDSFTLGGSWTITSEEATSGQNATLNYNFYADKVFLVLNPGNNKTAVIKVFLDGKLVDSSNEGLDVKNGVVIIDSDRLYNLIDLRGNPGSHILKLEFETPGTKSFAFTFG